MDDANRVVVAVGEGCDEEFAKARAREESVAKSWRWTPIFNLFAALDWGLPPIGAIHSLEQKGGSRRTLYTYWSGARRIGSERQKPPFNRSREKARRLRQVAA